MKERIAILGCGRMGRALIGGWIHQGVQPAHILALDPDPAAAQLQASFPGLRVEHPDRVARLDELPTILVVAVKPQAAEAALHALPPLAAGSTALSIVAGKSISFLERLLGPEVGVVRAMPNLPSAIGRGISVLVAGATVTPEQRDASAHLLDAVGETIWLASEDLLDAATAISGSGPAYVFLMVEALATAGEHLGLDHTVSLRLARATVAGAGAMAVSNDPAELRCQVVSPGGTTQAALEVLLEQTGFIGMIERATRAARDRARELGA
jgi:pyrroline-5-carboxylate reductase